MLHLLRHHLLLTWIVVVAAQYVLPFLQRVAKIRERTFDHFELNRHVRPKVGAIPQAALTAIQATGSGLAGFTHLGILTVEPGHGVYAFTGLYVDDATMSTLVQVIFVQTTFASKPQVVLLVQTHLGDGADLRLVGVSSTRSGGLVSGERPGTSGFALPGADPGTLLALHRRQLLAEPLPRLRVVSLDQAVQLLDNLSALQRAWWLSSGRMKRDRYGHLRLSWQQWLWWAARTGKAGRAVYANRMLARARKAEAALPHLPTAPTVAPVSSR